MKPAIENPIFNMVEESSIKNSFPVGVFPLNIQELINEACISLNFPLDFVCSSVLTVSSIAIGNSHRVKIMQGWEETAVIYMAIVGNKGTNKTHPLAHFITPIRDYDYSNYKIYKSQLKEYESNPEGVSKPSCITFLLSDFTLESLVKHHSINPRGIGVYSEELRSWFANFNRYNSGSEEEFWLSSFSKAPIRVDRKKEGTTLIENPFITVIGTIQPSVLAELVKGNKNNNGFIDRILFTYPEGLKKQAWSEVELNENSYSKWSRYVYQMLEWDYNPEGNPVKLEFSKEAKELLFKWQRELTVKLNAIDNEMLTGISAKMETYAPRFCLILELLYYVCGEGKKENISKRAVEGAIKLADYFTENAIRVREVIKENTTEYRKPHREVLLNELPKKFTSLEGEIIAEENNVSRATYYKLIKEKNLFSKAKKVYTRLDI